MAAPFHMSSGPWLQHWPDLTREMVRSFGSVGFRISVFGCCGHNGLCKNLFRVGAMPRIELKASLVLRDASVSCQETAHRKWLETIPVHSSFSLPVSEIVCWMLLAFASHDITWTKWLLDEQKLQTDHHNSKRAFCKSRQVWQKYRCLPLNS